MKPNIKNKVKFTKNKHKDTKGYQKVTKSKNFKNSLNNESFEENFQIEGRNPVLEAIKKEKPIDKILIKKGEIEGTLKVIIAKAIERGIIIQEVDRAKIDFLSRTNNHQGIIAICPAHEYCEIEDILQNAKDKNEPPFIIILDEITDPYNLGAIIRTADLSGAHGVIIPKRRAVGLTAIVSKTSAGAIEHVPVARVNNVSKEIKKLKKEGIWVACADMKGTTYFSADLKGPIAIVVGNEGHGVSRLVKEYCDFSVKIPMYGNIDSLNASVAASLVMYEVVRQRKF